MFVGKAWSLPLQWSPVRSFTQISSSVAGNRVEVTDSEKHSSLLRYRMKYVSEEFYSKGTWCQCYKNFCIVAKDRSK